MAGGVADEPFHPVGARFAWSSKPTQLSKAQIEAFTAVYDHNNRPVQALNDRTCYLDDTPDVTIR